MLTILLNVRLIFIGILILTLVSIGYFDYAVAVPSLNEPNLTAELVSSGLELPTSMAFLGPDDILVLEKNKGTVQRILNGNLLPEPLLDVNVATQSERGMIGMAVAKKLNPSVPTYVFLYYTEAESKDGEDLSEKKDPLGSRLYRYELVNDKLVNPKLLLDLPTSPGFSHNAGIVTIGPDNNVYVIVGDVNYLNVSSGNTLAQNIDGPIPDGRGGILRVTPNGEVVGGVGILGNEDPLNKYYAYGIRNSFGIAFDPLTGKLWDTENGSKHGDEINLVEPGFNSGWRQVTGMSTSTLNNKFDPANDLVDFEGKGMYSEPELDWQEEVGPTAITFLNSDKLGTQYENDLFVGTAHNNGNIYYFDLSDDRTELMLDGPLSDNVAENKGALEDITFGGDFGIITDLEIGPDGYLYVVSFDQGEIYRIVPAGEDDGNGNNDALDNDNDVSIEEEEDTDVE